MILVQLSDLHVRPQGVPAYRVVETNMLTERALRAVAALRPRPDGVVISGDLTDCGLPAEYALLRDMLMRHLSDIPVYLIPGNHDRRENLKALLSDFPGMAADPHFAHYTVETLSVRLIMLDSVVPGHGHGELCAERLAWLDQRLAEVPDKPTMLVLHHPPFVCGIRHMDSINLRDIPAFTNVVARHAQVERIVCGHHHRAITARVAGAIAIGAPGIAHQGELDLTGTSDGVFFMEPSSYQIHVWSEAAGLASHVAYVEPFPGPFPFLPDPDYPGRLP
jgi:3',5'-cyclic AMP phosphodiesterase CpdA